MRYCPRCKETKPLTEWHTGRPSYCVSCSKSYRRERYNNNPDLFRRQKRESSARNPEGNRNRSLKFHYGISLDTKLEMLAAQGGICPICKTSESKRWCVDHNHDTNALRLILCDPCNKAIGFMKENVVAIRASADYLESFYVSQKAPQ